ncbi:hypothetical protein ACHHYP_10847, partial [Achlya hypogyna]
ILTLFESQADDVNLSLEQTREVFKLLGLDLTEAQIKQLEDVPLDEFLRTLDAQSVTPAAEMMATTAVPAGDGTISYNQLHEFLRSCNLDVPQEVVLQYLALQSNATVTEADPLYFDKNGFAKFLEQLSPSPAPSPSKPDARAQKKSKAKARRRHRAP